MYITHIFAKEEALISLRTLNLIIIVKLAKLLYDAIL